MTTRTFRLTSPNMKGDDVKSLQKHLAGNNVIGRNFHPGKADGEFGPYSAAAVKRAKWDLGFPKRNVNRIAGSTFQKLLDGRAKRPTSYILRAKRRATKHVVSLSLRQKALASALKKEGLTESPWGSNRNWLTRWYYGNNTAAPWCAISVTHSYIEAGSKAFTKGRDFAYVPYMEYAAATGRGFTRIGKNEVEPGDMVTFNFDGGVADHVGIFVKWINKVSGTFVAIEGNTDAAGGAEGGEQMRRNRTMGLVSQFIRADK